MIKQQIIDYIKNEVEENNPQQFFREPIVGFSSADDELYQNIKKIVGEHHLFPQEVLPGAKTVVSFFIPFTKKVVESNKGAEVSDEWALSYIRCNHLISGICESLTEMLRKNGVKASGMKTLRGFDKENLRSEWSHRSAAYIAGLGAFGMHRLLISKKGAAGRYGSLIISEKIDPDVRPGKEYCVSRSGGDCDFCIKNCPLNALAADSFDRHNCYERVCAINDSFKNFGLCNVCGKCLTGPCAIKSLAL
jgi:epoxyqueuosine reductase QueG